MPTGQSARGQTSSVGHRNEPDRDAVGSKDPGNAPASVLTKHKLAGNTASVAATGSVRAFDGTIVIGNEPGFPEIRNGQVKGDIHGDIQVDIPFDVVLGNVG